MREALSNAASELARAALQMRGAHSNIVRESQTRAKHHPHLLLERGDSSQRSSLRAVSATAVVSAAALTG